MRTVKDGLTYIATGLGMAIVATAIQKSGLGFKNAMAVAIAAAIVVAIGLVMVHYPSKNPKPDEPEE